MGFASFSDFNNRTWVIVEKTKFNMKIRTDNFDQNYSLGLFVKEDKA